MIFYADVPLSLSHEARDVHIDIGWSLPSKGVEHLGRIDRTLYPEPKIGTFCWPQGASRHAVAWYLVTEDQLNQIRNKTRAGENQYNSAELHITDGHVSLKTQMYVLPAQPVHQTDPKCDLYILPLVDDRYYWWGRRGEISITEGTTTWAQLVSSIATLLGITITVQGSIDSAYLKPPSSLESTYRALPLLLDAVADSIGRKVVRKYDGSVLLPDYSTAKTVYDRNKSKYYELHSGGEYVI